MKPNEILSNLSLPLVGGGRWELDQENPPLFALLEFYRGVHCPQCKRRLEDLAIRIPELRESGIGVIAISMDDQERARRSAAEWNIGQLRLAYGLQEADARSLGLFISKAFLESDPRLFSEPGTYLVRPDRSLYACSISSLPVFRPPFSDIWTLLEVIRKWNYPARGDQ